MCSLHLVTAEIGGNRLGFTDFMCSKLYCFLAVFQFSTYFPGYFDGQYWLWWVFLVLGECLAGERCLKML